jgi:hypothetical protein
VNQAFVQRYVPLLVWILALLALLLIPLKIVGTGYLPIDDALRHAAKVVSGKPWSEIVVMREGFPMDHHAGWHAVLGWAHAGLRCGADGLVALSVVFLFWLVAGLPLIWIRRPEAWLAGWLICAVAHTGFIGRVNLGRPFLLTTAAMMAMLFAWYRRPEDRASWRQLALAILCITLSGWLHGSWYLWVLPVAAFFLAGCWRSGGQLLGCWLAGSFLGAALTGHPLVYLAQATRHLLTALGQDVVQRTLVTEFQPTDGCFPVVVCVIVVLFWRRSAGQSVASVVYHPIFLLGVLGWLLGLKVTRFWEDWGLPAFLVWMALQLQELLEIHLDLASAKRLLVTGLLAAGLFLVATSDLRGRWTNGLAIEFLTMDNPALAGWLPDAGGILYSADMGVYYQTFFKNPKAPWRYMLGSEPALMPAEDYEIWKKINWNYGSMRTYQPWVKKIRPADRLVIRGSSDGCPAIPELEWYYAVRGTWIGRLPRGAKPASATTQP